MNALVAGGAGFIGSHLVDALLAQGDRVTVVDNFLTGRTVNLEGAARHETFRLLEADVSDPGLDVGRDEPFDRVYHLACPASPKEFTRHPVEILMVNAQGTRNLLEIARRDGARFLVTSTSEVYGEPEVHPQTEEYRGNVSCVGPRSCYDEGKRFAESLTMTYHRQYGVDVRIARLFNTYGPRMAPEDGRIVSNFLVQALAGEPLTIHGDGSQTRSFCYVDDTVRGLIALMESGGASGEVVNLGNPVEYTVMEVAERVLELTGSDAGVAHLPLPVDDPTKRRPDISKARQLLGWRPEVALEGGLRCTLDSLARELRLQMVGGDV